MKYSWTYKANFNVTSLSFVFLDYSQRCQRSGKDEHATHLVTSEEEVTLRYFNLLFPGLNLFRIIHDVRNGKRTALVKDREIQHFDIL